MRFVLGFFGLAFRTLVNGIYPSSGSLTLLASPTEGNRRQGFFRRLPTLKVRKPPRGVLGQGTLMHLH